MALLLGGCRSSELVAGGSGQSDNQGTGAGGAIGTGGATGTGAGGSAGTGAGGAGGAPCSTATCGGVGQYCSTCGPRAGTCVDGPADCSEPEQIVCGCDGNLYRSPCDANLAHVDVVNGCETPPGKFRCGTQFCTSGAQYCVRYLFAYACADLPAACGTTPTCACIAEPKCNACTVSADGIVTVECVQTSSP